ncbi:MAG: DUF4118 domain-containing protein [Methylophilaceae bacterium]
MPKPFIKSILALTTFAVATAVSYRFFDTIDITGITMLYLLAVVFNAYFLGFFFSLATAISAFIAINFLFIAPQYTLHIASPHSWVALISFMMVSVVISSLLKRLQAETNKALNAKRRVQFSKELIEHIATSSDINELLNTSSRLIQQFFNKPTAIAQIQSDLSYLITHHHRLAAQPDKEALEWVAETGKVIGPHTDNWPDSHWWIIPFDRLPSKAPVMVIGDIDANTSDELLGDLKGHADQIYAVYQRLIHLEQSRQAELIAQEESIQNALLASISHDMRTPLTAILGAATSLSVQGELLSAEEHQRLLGSITSEARHLSTSTENILALVQLESAQSMHITLDWQSPEEIIGTLLVRYRERDNTKAIVTDIKTSSLIKANATLLSQALANLMDNALVAHQGTEPIMVCIKESNHTLSVSVKDRGTGFSRDFSADDIKKFSQRDKNSKGFGLGLAIVQAIAHKHKARLTIENREGGGSKVALIFPAESLMQASD